MPDAYDGEAGRKAEKLHCPEEIAERLGGITVKSLTELIRKNGLSTTTLGHAAPSRKGGPSRRLWGMTDAQLGDLLSLRCRRGRMPPPERGQG